MKKPFAGAALLVAATSGFSQAPAYVNFNNFRSGFHQAIYNTPTPADATTTIQYAGYTTYEQQGSSATDLPAGTTVYSGAPLGGTTATGSLYMTQLLASPGFDQPLNSLVPVGTPNTFETVAPGAGYLRPVGSQAELVNPNGSQATIAIAAWATGGGIYTTLASAQAAGEPWGISALANINGTFSPQPAAEMSGASNLNLSFSLGIPEPSTIALGVMGAATLLFRRRK